MSNERNTGENMHEASVMNDEPEGVAQPETIGEEAQRDAVPTEAPQVNMESLQEALEEANRQASDNWDRFMRAQAELDNVQKRNKRDLENVRKFALEKFVIELLAVRDSLEMGLAHTKDEDVDPDKLREGSELTLRMLMQVMEKFSVDEIDPAGEAFDPKVHEAVAMVPSAEVEPNSVLEVHQKGYLLNDRLIRPARVVVAKSPDQ